MSDLAPDRNQIEIFIDAVLRYRGQEGYFSLRAFFHDNKPLAVRLWHAPLDGSYQFLIDRAVDMALRAANEPKPAVFCPPLAVFNGPNGQAREQDLSKGLVLSVECDEHAGEARCKLEGILGETTAIVRSGGQCVNGEGQPEDKLHLHWRLRLPAIGDALLKLKLARRLATAIAGGDPSNIPAVHCLRWPGSWHRKGEPRLCEIVHLNADREIDLDEALAALEAAAPEPTGRAGGAPGDGEAGIPADTMRVIREGSSSDRSQAFWNVLVVLKRLGFTLEDIVSLLERYPNGIAKKYEGRLRQEVERVYKKLTPPPATTNEPLFDPWEPYIVPDFPLHILPPVVQKYVASQAVIIGCDPAALAMAALVAISGALDHRFAVKMMRHGNWWEHPRLWALLVGDPSRKKTPVINDATRPLERHQKDLLQDYDARVRDYESAGGSVKEPDPPVRYVASDITTEKLCELLSRSDHGLLIKRDEFAGWLGAMEKYSGSSRGIGADRGVWLQAYDGGPHTVDRIVRGENYIGNLSVSLIGGIQPAKLIELHGLTSDGLLQRFLPVMMRASTLPCDRENQDQKEYHHLVYTLIMARHQRLILASDALDVMNDLRAYLHDLEHACGGLAEGFQAFVGKLAGVAGRLAVILHAAANWGNIPREIAAETVRNVRCLIVDFLLPHAFEFYGTAEGMTVGERLRKIASWILTSEQKTVTARELIRNVRCLRGVAVFDLQTYVSPLVAGGWLEPGKPGPDNRSWTVSPMVARQFERQRELEEERKGLVAKLMRSPRKEK